MTVGRQNVTSRTLQAEKTKKKLYRIAVSLFGKYGYHNVTIKDICTKANMSVGIFYHYYENKASIISEMVARRDKTLRAYADSCAELPADDQLISVLGYYARITREIGVDAIRVLYNPENVLVEHAGMRDDTGEIVRIIDDIVTRGQQDGVFRRDETSHEIVRFISVALRGLIYDWCRVRGDYDLEDSVSAYMTQLLALFCAPKA